MICNRRSECDFPKQVFSLYNFYLYIYINLSKNTIRNFFWTTLKITSIWILKIKCVRLPECRLSCSLGFKLFHYKKLVILGACAKNCLPMAVYFIMRDPFWVWSALKLLDVFHISKRQCEPVVECPVTCKGGNLYQISGHIVFCIITEYVPCPSETQLIFRLQDLHCKTPSCL